MFREFEGLETKEGEVLVPLVRVECLTNPPDVLLWDL